MQAPCTCLYYLLNSSWCVFITIAVIDCWCYLQRSWPGCTLESQQPQALLDAAAAAPEDHWQTPMVGGWEGVRVSRAPATQTTYKGGDETHFLSVLVQLSAACVDRGFEPAPPWQPHQPRRCQEPTLNVSPGSSCPGTLTPSINGCVTFRVTNWWRCDMQSFQRLPSPFLSSIAAVDSTSVMRCRAHNHKNKKQQHAAAAQHGCVSRQRS